ncbi:MAG: 4-(cytidine 5'-diphospho)-2-C-methyl-D-erythritol kinase [Pirellulaceae bacterium]|nr:4-(cytidine 5'-diphospho)-2-C-methyl-D-erythritol kinase [Pirellulaceae bacterium]
MHLRWRGAFIQIQAPAKLNLFLEVLARRPDGFHELETLLTAIDIFDTVLIRDDPGQLRLSCRWADGVEAGRRAVRLRAGGSSFDELPAAEGNLAWRAAEHLRRTAGVERGARIHVIKRIPAAAGLGGASSDAAATLAGLNQLWNLNYSAAQLAQLGSELGSDIPFFLASGCPAAGAAVCRGRGERVEPVASGGRLHFVVARPPEGLSTAAVYAACRPAVTACRVERLARALARGDAAGVARQLHNRLQEAARGLSPWVDRLQRDFERLGCLGHQMSGSGTSYFGLVRHARQARRAASLLRASGLDAVFAASSVGFLSGKSFGAGQW